MEVPDGRAEATGATDESAQNGRQKDVQARTCQIEEQELKRLLRDEAMKLPDLNIAMSGMAGRFPKADSVDEFEALLRQGVDMVNNQDEARFQCGLWGLPPRAGRLKDLSRFDHEFFGYTHEEANYLDFQLRILYEVVYESIVDAGVNPSALRGTKTGVFFGLHCNEFENALADDPSFKSNGYYAQFAIKVAQYFDLRGITLTFDAACASGFVGLHNAVEALRDGLIEQAIVCSSNIPVHPTGSFIFFQMQMLSPSGYSRFLDSRADGYVKSEACVSVLLQRKHLARRNYCSFMATMTSVDGYKPEGITFPSDKSQESLIRSTKRLAGVSTNHVEYIEAHGTGTPAGDPQEARAISSVYYPLDEPGECAQMKTGAEVEAPAQERRTIGPLLVGSVKTNMGHSEAASGLCALAKAALMLEHELIYPSLHFAQPNTNIQALMDGRLKFVDQLRPLRAKIIPLSCYGFGGSNVHVIVRANEREQLAVQLFSGGSARAPRLVAMFGRSEHALNCFFDAMLAKSHYHTDDFLTLVDSLSLDRIDRLMKYRGYMILERTSGAQLARSIAKCELEPGAPRERRAHFQEAKQRACHLLMPGLGSEPELAGLHDGLKRIPEFWSTMRRLNELLAPLDPSVNLEEPLGECPEASLCQKFVWIVAAEVALVNVVRDQLRLQRVRSVVGHSLGEVACAYAVGALDEREAVMVAYQLGRACDQLSAPHLAGGKTVSISGLSERQLSLAIRQYPSLRIVCKNGPNSLTVSGRGHEIDQFCARQLDSSRAEPSKVLIKQLCDRLALHNEALMDRPEVRRILSEALERVLLPGAEYPRGEPARWRSCFATGHQMAQANAEYFVEMLCRPVDLEARLGELEPDDLVVELALKPSLEPFVGAALDGRLNYVRLFDGGLSRRAQSCVELELIQGLGRLYLAGANFDLSHYYRLHEKNLVPVRRCTPSLAALLRWEHGAQLFVPRYPAQFSKPSAKCEMPVDLVQDRDKYLAGHCVDGRVLYPATGYLFIIWRVFSFTKRKIYDACFHDVERELLPIEFRDVRLWRAIILGNRVAQIYVQFEEATGRFEIKEGGSVVAEGWARSPTERPEGLLHGEVRERIEAERLECTMDKEDVYKQFRVNGYDYGASFQNIAHCSSDGRFCRVKFNGHFVALTDSILQSIFLAVADYAPTSGGLFLPTRFEYVRFQPEMILRKLHACRWSIDESDGSLNTRAKRETMNKMLQRDAATGSGDQQAAGGAEPAEQNEQKKEKQERQEEEEQPLECFFDTYCDPITKVIVSDGIEMRGIRATPAPRRIENTNELLLESQQFVCDFEEPVLDEPLTGFARLQLPYGRICDSLASELLLKLCGLDSAGAPRGLPAAELASRREVEAYMARHLACQWAPACEQQQMASPEAHQYDIRRNAPRTLLSVLDQLASETAGVKRTLEASTALVRERIQQNRTHLMRDLIQDSFTCERFMRPLVEQVLENACTKKSKLRMLEINLDDGLVGDHLERLISLVEPQLLLDYALAHPEPDRLHGSQLRPATKTYTLKAGESGVHRLLQESQQQLGRLDLLVFKDISCYSLPKQVVEENGLGPLMSGLSSALKQGGYCLLMMRSSLTLAERILLALSEPKLVGISRRDLDELRRERNSDAFDKIQRINELLASRCKMMLDEAERSHLLCVASKSDANGCQLLMFRRMVAKNHEQGSNGLQELQPQRDRLILRVQHDQLDWLDALKANFRDAANAEAQGATAQQARVVWLCAVSTKEQPISGLIGMFQALRKELGSDLLRCFYDECTFAERAEPVSVHEIEQSAPFRLALERDQLWFCVRKQQVGAFRHVTINEQLGPDGYSCASQPAPDGTEALEEKRGAQADAYVNNVTRGDLSSFAWHEAPFRYLDEQQRSELVRVAYSALNFRDVMLASGKLPLDAIPLRLAQADCLLGLEFSGVTPAGATGGAKRVMGMVYGRGLATSVICPRQSSLVIEIPPWLSLEEAASIPVAYATAIMAIVYRGRARRGESILIHAGSGGVGQAALHLAAKLGLEVFATVGTEEKRRFLLEEFPEVLSNERIFSSRDCSFESDLLRATRGRGVDLVLNSLADDKLQASINCLADGGRFLEIGKFDMSVNSALELLKLEQNKTFHGILLDKLFDVEDVSESFCEQLKCVSDTLGQGLRDGFVRPIKRQVFQRHQIEQAFRFMAAGKHIGKVLIAIEPKLEQAPELGVGCGPLKCVPRFHLDPRKAYLVTGGLGGFGLELCKWLVGVGGARHLTLTSRTGPRTGYQEATLRRLRASGCQVQVVTSAQADPAESRAQAERLCELARSAAPSGQLGGVFHLAMVLRDSLLENMTREDFELVLRPKMSACLHLDEATASSGHRSELFVAFSSVTSGKGNAGQANYAYANSCLERVCERRRARGHHALAVQWGVIGDVGAAFERLGGNGAVIGGTLPQRIPSCLATLGKLLGSPFAVCSSVLPVSRHGCGPGAQKHGAGGDLVGAIMHVLGIKDSSKVSEEASLGELGLDSLMAVEIRQYIEREYDMTLNIQEIRSLTIAKIREISETHRPSDKSLSAATSASASASTTALGAAPKPPGEQPESGANTNQSGKAAAAAAATTAAQLEQRIQIDKSLVASFVPKLELPEASFVRLNFKQFDKAQVPRRLPLTFALLESNEPIFFIPPIHGDFGRLETVCASIRRPCIGLNWTHRLGSCESVRDAVAEYLRLLRAADWQTQFQLPLETNDGGAGVQTTRTVHLVGYSFGATVAFELMLALAEQQKQRCANGAPRLEPGHLVLLDGSPKQIELGSKYLTGLTSRRPLSRAEKADELLMIYVSSNLSKRNKLGELDYWQMRDRLKQAQSLEAKVEFASARLAEMLKLQEGARGSGCGASACDDTGALDRAARRIARAMEAFCRKYELINNYKAEPGRQLATDCTLVRAEQIYLKESSERGLDELSEAGRERAAQFNEDLGLTSLVGGRLDLHVMLGDHETFLNRNRRSIGEIIAKNCSSKREQLNHK